jgi:hypothetical protein
MPWHTSQKWLQDSTKARFDRVLAAVCLLNENQPVRSAAREIVPGFPKAMPWHSVGSIIPLGVLVGKKRPGGNLVLGNCRQLRRDRQSRRDLDRDGFIGLGFQAAALGNLQGAGGSHDSGVSSTSIELTLCWDLGDS